jgi:glycogen debranching enzyme
MGPPGVLHIERKRFLWGERLFERICCVNYSRDTVLLPLTLEFDADFKDMFEVRARIAPTQRRRPAISTVDGWPTAISAWMA